MREPDTSEDFWGQGDYERVARRLRPAAHVLVRAADVVAGQRVLDLGAGTGNVAIAAARRGAKVVALDASPALVEMGRAATAGAGLDVEWVVGSFDSVDAPDGSFDVVLSAFGLIYAADPGRALDEACRVCAPGGALGVATWADGGFQHQAGRIVALSSGAEPPPSPWGGVDGLRQAFVARALTLEWHDERFEWCFPSLGHWWDEAQVAAPPLVAALESIDDAGRERLRQEVLDATEAFVSETPDGVTILQHALIAVARLP